MRSFRKNKQEGSAEKAFKTSGKDLVITFVLKTLIPLVPIVVVIFLAGLIMNSEVTGYYEGLAPGLGAVKLTLKEDNEQLSGKLILRRNSRFVIIDGKMLDDNKMVIHLRKEMPGDELVEITSSTEISKPNGNSGSGNSGSNNNNNNSSNESKLANGFSDTAKDNAADKIDIKAKKDQNDIEGILETNGNAQRFKVTRSSFEAFLGKRWISRSLNYFGTKIKL